MKRFRILSLDGGGIRGSFTASVAANLEQITRKRLVDHFDLIAGTSTGGIIALGLGLELSAEEILRFYRDRGPQIFPTTGLRRPLHVLRHVFSPKHSQDVLKKSLKDVFGSRKLGESKCRLVVPSYDCNSGRVQLFKTAHHPRFRQDHLRLAVDVAMATAAAPTYFPAFATQDGQAFLDGGVWANCPAVVGLLEAVFVLNCPAVDVEILSIGTTEATFDVSKWRRLGGLLSWNYRLVELLMRAQVDGAKGQARIITGRDAYYRVDEVTRPGRFSLDDAGQIKDLSGLGARRAREAVEHIESRFLDRPVERFVPHYEPTSGEPKEPDRPSTFLVDRRRRRRSLGLARANTARDPYTIVNISSSGAFLQTDRPIPVDTLLDLRIVLENQVSVGAAARVVRVQEPNWVKTAGIGIEFVGLDHRARQEIDRYVADDPSPSSSAGSTLETPTSIPAAV